MKRQKARKVQQAKQAESGAKVSGANAAPTAKAGE